MILSSTFFLGKRRLRGVMVAETLVLRLVCRGCGRTFVPVPDHLTDCGNCEKNKARKFREYMRKYWASKSGVRNKRRYYLKHRFEILEKQRIRKRLLNE